MTAAGGRAACPVCGAYQYDRVDENTKAVRVTSVNVWEDNTASVEDESGDWEPEGDTTFGDFTCVNGHPVSKDFGAFLDELVDSAWGDVWDIPKEVLA